MIKAISEKFTLSLVRRNVIKEEEKNIYIYGYELIIASVLCKSIALLIGILLGRPFESIIFLSIFFLIRIYAGGYHASSHFNCIILFNITFLISMLITKVMIENSLYILIYGGMMVSGIIIYLYAPIEDRNKPLDENERIKYRKIARIRTSIILMSIYCLLSLFPNMIQLLSFPAIAVWVAAAVVIIGKFKNEEKKWTNCKKMLRKKQLPI